MTRFVFATLGANSLRIGDCCNIFIFAVEDQKICKGKYEYLSLAYHRMAMKRYGLKSSIRDSCLKLGFIVIDSLLILLDDFVELVPGLLPLILVDFPQSSQLGLCLCRIFPQLSLLFIPVILQHQFAFLSQQFDLQVLYHLLHFFFLYRLL
jgi:hypothetical protein